MCFTASLSNDKHFSIRGNRGKNPATYELYFRVTIHEGKFFFYRQSQLLITEELTELENHHFAIPSEIMDLNSHQ